MQSGTGTAAGISGVDVAGKTGTTTNYADAWFVGWTPQLTTAVWVGFPDRLVPMTTLFNGGPVEGGSFPALIWHDFMTQALQILASETPTPNGPSTTPSTSSGIGSTRREVEAAAPVAVAVAPPAAAPRTGPPGMAPRATGPGVAAVARQVVVEPPAVAAVGLRVAGPRVVAVPAAVVGPPVAAGPPAAAAARVVAAAAAAAAPPVAAAVRARAAAAPGAPGSAEAARRTSAIATGRPR